MGSVGGEYRSIVRVLNTINLGGEFDGDVWRSTKHAQTPVTKSKTFDEAQPHCIRFINAIIDVNEKRYAVSLGQSTKTSAKLLPFAFSTPSCKMIVPSNLVSYIQGTEPHDMSLRDCNKNMWQLKIEKFGEDWYFTDGWVDFVKDNMIKGGDVLFYQYSSRGLLDFKVLGSSHCENDGNPPLDTKGQDEPVEVKIEEEEAADDIDERPHKKRSNRPPKETGVDGRASGRKRERGKKRMFQDYYGADVFSSGEVSVPTNPFFVTITRKTRVNEMYIPSDVIKSHGLHLPEVMVLEDSEGRKFRTMRTSWKDKRLIYCGGWKAICKVNLAGKDDKLICEFVPGEDEDLQIKVTFVRAK